MLKVYAIVNYQTCGWCKKFRPVLESNIKALNPKSQAHIEVVDLTTSEGQSKKDALGYRGGIPCVIATVGENKVLEEPGYKDGPKFANMLFNLFSMYG